MVNKDPARIRRMFAEIAPRYDRANRVLSFRRDVAWRGHVAGALLQGPGLILDLAAGTGDLAVDLERAGHRVIAADLTLEMLVAGRAKVASPRISQVNADGLRLPFHPACFDAVTIAFGIRNFSAPAEGLREMVRVTRSGGSIGVLEFSRPGALLAPFYALYSRFAIPFIGGLITGERTAYEYLPRSVAEFPEGEHFLALMREAGLEKLTAHRMTGGIVTFYRGTRP